MACFCHQCGQRNEDDANFCESCGTPLRKPAAPPPATPAASASPVAPSSLPAAKGAGLPKAALAGIAVVALVAAGALGWFLLADGKPSEGALLTASNSWLDGQRASQESAACLRNFDYGKSPVFVSPDSRSTREWLDALVEAGIYQAPETVTSGSGYWARQQLRYEHGEQAARYIRGGRLCAAERLEVSAVSFDPQSVFKAEDSQWVAGSATLSWDARAPWSRHATLAGEFDEVMNPRTVDMAWRRAKDGGWEVVSRNQYAQAQRGSASGDKKATAPATQAQAGSSSGGGFGDWLGKLFGGGGGAEKMVESFYRDIDGGRAEQAATAVIPDPQLEPAKLKVLLEAKSVEFKAKGGIARISTRYQAGSNGAADAVEVEIGFNDGSTMQERVEVAKVDGDWKLSLD